MRTLSLSLLVILFLAGTQANEHSIATFSTGDNALSPKAARSDSLVVGDLDGDGDLDVVVADNRSQVRIHWNRGTRDPFRALPGAPLVDAGRDPTLTLGDVDGDNRLDILHGSYDGLQYLLNREQFNVAHPIHPRASSLAAGDLNGDGNVDVVITIESPPVLQWFANDGSLLPFENAIAQVIPTSATAPGLHGFTSHVKLADVENDGDLDVIFISNTTQLKRRSYVVFNNGTLAPFSDNRLEELLNVPEYALDFVTADFTGDGLVDIVVAAGGKAPSELFRNNGTDSPFDGVEGIPVMDESRMVPALGAADMDGDGDIDLLAGLAIFNELRGINRLYLNDGSATPFRDGPGLPVSLNEFHTVEIVPADLNGDGRPDVVCGNIADSPNFVYFNAGPPRFFLPDDRRHIDQGNDFPYWIVSRMADLDGDQDMDLVVADSSGLRYSPNGGNPRGETSWIPIQLPARPAQPEDMVVDDFTGDGRPDIVVGNYLGPDYLMINNGTDQPFSGVSAQILSPSPNRTQSLALADFNRDGRLDLLVGGHASWGPASRSRIHYNSGNPIPFSDSVVLPDPPDPVDDIIAGDVNGDGFPDIVIASWGEPPRILINNRGADSFNPPARELMANAPRTSTKAMDLGDVDMDGDLDLVVAGNSNLLFLNNGSPDPFSGVQGLPIDGFHIFRSHQALLVDMNRDGRLDLVLTGDGGGNLYLNDGNTNPFNTGTRTPLSIDRYSGNHADVGDLDGDGFLDLVVGDRIYFNLEPNARLITANLPDIVSAPGSQQLAIDLDRVTSEIGRNRFFDGDRPIGDANVWTGQLDWYGITAGDHHVSVEINGILGRSASNIAADFGADPTTGVAPHTVSFHDQSDTIAWTFVAIPEDGTSGSATEPVSTGDPDGSPELFSVYRWDFGDGTTSDLPDPVKTYAEPGVYSVRLTVERSDGATASVSKPDFIRVTESVETSEPPPVDVVETQDWIRSSPASDAEGRLYFGSADGYLYAVAPDLSVRWKFAANAVIEATPALGPDGTVYFGAWDGRFHAVDTSAGRSLWSYQTGALITASAAVADSGDVYIGSLDGNLYAFTRDGALRWLFATDGPISSSVAIGSDGSLFFGSSDKRFYALDSNGKSLWTFEADGVIKSSPALDLDRIFFGAEDGDLYAISRSGDLIWRYTTAGRIVSSPVIGLHGNIHVGSTDRGLHTVTRDGEALWIHGTGGSINGAPAVDSAGWVYFGSLDNKVYSVDATGVLGWILETGGDVESSGAISPDGMLYLTSYDHKLYALDIGRGPAPTPWPMFRQAPDRRGAVQEPIKLAHPRLAPDGFGFRLLGQSTEPVVVETSTDLRRWIAIEHQTIHEETGDWIQTVWQPREDGFRFFRVRRDPR